MVLSAFDCYIRREKECNKRFTPSFLKWHGQYSFGASLSPSQSNIHDTRLGQSKRLSDVTHLSYDVLMDNGVKLDCPGGQALDADSYHAIGTGG